MSKYIFGELTAASNIISCKRWSESESR